MRFLPFMFSNENKKENKEWKWDSLSFTGFERFRVSSFLLLVLDETKPEIPRKRWKAKKYNKKTDVNSYSRTASAEQREARKSIIHYHSDFLKFYFLFSDYHVDMSGKSTQQPKIALLATLSNLMKREVGRHLCVGCYVWVSCYN